MLSRSLLSLRLSLSLPPSAGVSALLVCALAVSGCTSSSEEPKKAAVRTTTTTAAAKPTSTVSPFTAKGMPAALAAVIKPVYFGGAVRSSAPAGKALHRRKVVKAGGRVVVTGSVSTWKGVPIAVVTRGKDVTLAVKAPRWKVVGGWWPSIGVGSPSLGSGPRRVLVLGSDARKGEPVDRSRADSLHIVGYDGHRGGGVVGIARDAYVPLATGGRGKINSALALGGPVGTQRTVASATGVPLEGYLLTSFNGFRTLINGIGGLPLNAPVAVKDVGSGANVRAGSSTLAGTMALAYARARYGVAGGDFGRSGNQGRLILAAGGLTKLAGPRKLPGLLRSVGRSVTTNLSAEQVLTLAAAAHVTSPTKVKNRVAAGGVGMSTGGESIVLLDANARALFADIKDGKLS